MRKKRETKDEPEEEKKVEMMKAAAQAWLSHSHTSKRTVSEFAAQPRHASVKGKASRFKVEALSTTKHYPLILELEYGESSLWDPYEIVEVSKKLERGLTLEEQTFSVTDRHSNGFKKNSLRSLFSRSSSGRFKQT